MVKFTFFFVLIVCLCYNAVQPLKLLPKLKEDLSNFHKKVKCDLHYVGNKIYGHAHENDLCQTSSTKSPSISENNSRFESTTEEYLTNYNPKSIEEKNGLNNNGIKSSDQNNQIKDFAKTETTQKNVESTTKPTENEGLWFEQSTTPKSNKTGDIDLRTNLEVKAKNVD